MILTREMAEKAKALIGVNRQNFYVRGVCRAIRLASNEQINILSDNPDFWASSDFPKDLIKWPLTPEGDDKRRAFIDSLIGKDL